jgi:hypothetical protein
MQQLEGARWRTGFVAQAPRLQRGSGSRQQARRLRYQNRRVRREPSAIHRMRLNHASDSRAEVMASTAASAENSEVTSVSFFSSVKREVSAR